MKNRPCPSCRAQGRDRTGNHLYLMRDGVTWHCDRCQYTEREGEIKIEMNVDAISKFSSSSIDERKIKKSIVDVFKVKMGVDETSGEVDSHFYPITKAGNITGYKVRKLPKEFYSVGDTKGAIELFGQAVIPKGGKKLLITGGELDALAAYQMLLDKYPNFTPSVVSLPKGENASAVKENLEYVLSFQEVLIYTDMDEPGRKAAEVIAALVGPAKARIVSTSEKDACDMLKAGKQAEFINAFFNAEKHKPKGIINGKDIDLESVKRATVKGYDLPYPILNRMIGGLRKGELTTLTAGSGIGKSTMAKEVGHHLRSAHDLTVGNLFLEETLEKTIQSYIAIDNNVPLAMLRKNPALLTDEQWQKSFERIMGNDKWYALQHFGSLPTDELLAKMRYLAYGAGCDFIILDHLSLVFSGQANDNERIAIDNAMTELAAFCNESGVGIITVVHLSRNKAKGSFNEGAEISLNDLRGSAALEQLSWNVLGLERSQQAEDEEAKNTSRIRILKARETGFTGMADECIYDFTTGRLLPKTGISLSY